MFTTQNVLLFLSTLLCALITGLLYGYACSVNPGLQKLSDTAYLSAMQSINKEIQNPVFFASFFGSFLIIPITAWYSYNHPTPATFYLLLTATLFFIFGVVGVTIFGNIPLNERLAGFSIDKASEIELINQRKVFENAWNRYHNLRTVCSLFSLILVITAVIKKSSNS